ncbi:MAG TPA: PIG-L family deacetylase [Caldilineaceae bacterium]|nr:PIG-L family deacetylase [Caldilineaceae bacterium]
MRWPGQFGTQSSARDENTRLCTSTWWIGTRAQEAQASAEAFLAGANASTVVIKEFRDGYFPYEGAAIKDYFETLKALFTPDLIFTHYRQDSHQDHRLLNELTWNTFRDHLILEYEIPKYDGDLGRPNLYVQLDGTLCERKIDLLMTHFATQANKHWFTRETFASLMRLRGIEARSPGGYAEAFYGHKLVI